jgi:hypothetical protein
LQVEAPAVRHTAAHAPENQGLNNSLDYVAADWSRVILHPHVAGKRQFKKASCVKKLYETVPVETMISAFLLP